MGKYFNPGNAGFREVLREEYVDKTGLIAMINETIATKKKLTCISRPRRFGKSYAAMMLSAYYDRTCDSGELFTNLIIAEEPSFLVHLNKYNVISLDISGIISDTKNESREMTSGNIPSTIVSLLLAEARKLYPELPYECSLSDALREIVQLTGCRFIFIIDEWDAPIREAKNDPKAQSDYLSMLRGWFKNNNFTPDVVAAAYMTGILPVKKDGSQSALSDFNEFSMINPRRYARYVGFTEQEVRGLCIKHGMDFSSMKAWYDGYSFPQESSVYNPNSVMKAVDYGEFDSYWTETSAAEGLMDYIGRDYKGLTRKIAELIAGMDIPVNPSGFANDLTTFYNQDDVLTLLIHLGYLSYNAETGTARIPNEEIRREFAKRIRDVSHAETQRRLAESDQLLLDTIEGNEEAVATQIEKVHAEETSPLHYNREESLRSVIKLAYYTYRDHYLQWEELPAGVGYADILYLPKKDSAWPPILVELKWNKSAEGAVSQILRKDYPKALRGYGGEILLVGINYDKDAPAGERKHTCKIIRYKA